MPPDLWERLEEIDARHKDSVNARPENSFTTQEYAKHYGMCESHARKCIKDLTQAGKLKRFRFGNAFYFTIV